MAEFANILPFASPRSGGTADRAFEVQSEPVRLIPGRDILAPAKKPTQSVHDTGDCEQNAFPTLSGRTKLGSSWPEWSERICPSAVGLAIFDVVAIVTVMELMSRIHALGSVLARNESAFFLMCFLVLAAHQGAYQNRSPRGVWPVILAVFGTNVLSELAFGLSSPRKCLLIAFTGVLIGSLLLVVRYLQRITVFGDCNQKRNVLLVGDQQLTQQVADAIHLDQFSLRKIKAFLPSHHFFGVHGSQMLLRIARQECVDEVIVATRNVEVADEIIRLARGSQLDVAVVPNFDTAPPLAIENIGGLSLLRVHEERLPVWRLTSKRLADITLATAALVLLAPVLLAIALVIKLDSRGTALYRSLRVGRKGRRFICYKFRTMIEDADLHKERLRSRNERHGAFFKIASDPRITSVGRFLRRYSLDELPQLWNVLRGDMSVVGPRPHPVDDVERYGLEDLQRLDVIPGMTGLWQVTARQSPSFARCVALDVEYIKRWSPLLDFQILCKTARCVLQGNGA